MDKYKKLYIVRHGKAMADYGDISDIDRPLKESGINDAYQISKKLSGMNETPRIIISSHAVRALHTATIFAGTFKLSYNQIIIHKDLYTTNIKAIVDLIKNTNDDVQSIILFGHNPTFTELANRFLTDKIDQIPTTGVVGLKFNINTWQEIQAQNLVEWIFIHP